MGSTTINDKTIIQKLFNLYIDFLKSNEEIQLETVLDEKNRRYLLIEVGWENGYRIYGTLLHIDVINDKLWIQHDGTEEGIAHELVDLGIPKNRIVLGYQPIDRRELMEFAIS